MAIMKCSGDEFENNLGKITQQGVNHIKGGLVSDVQLRDNINGTFVFDHVHFKDAQFTFSKMWGSSFNHCKFERAGFSNCELVSTNFRKCEFIGSDLVASDLTNASFVGCKSTPKQPFYDCIMKGVNLSGFKGMRDMSKWLQNNFECTKEGVYAYKMFAPFYDVPSYWTVKEGAVIEEVVSPDASTDCGSGVNVATKDWLAELVTTTAGEYHNRFISPRQITREELDYFKERYDGYPGLWEVFIPWIKMVGAVIPLNTDGKFRVGYAELKQHLDFIELFPHLY